MTITTILSREDCIKRLDSFIKHNDMGTIFPENFFTSLRHHIDLGHPDINSLADERDDLKRKAEDGTELWLWQINNNVFVAYDNPYPCHSEFGDPMTVGEPAATATFINSVPGARHDN